jgi:phosphopantetheinyl transferase (holo-ACP synthase)
VQRHWELAFPMASTGAISKCRTGVTLRVAGAAHERLVEFTPQGRVARIQISCSDDRELAQAFVVVSALRL